MNRLEGQVRAATCRTFFEEEACERESFRRHVEPAMQALLAKAIGKVHLQSLDPFPHPMKVR